MLNITATLHDYTVIGMAVLAATVLPYSIGWWASMICMLLAVSKPTAWRR